MITYPINFEWQKGGKRKHPDELTQVSGQGDNSAKGRFKRRLQLPQRGEVQR